MNLKRSWSFAPGIEFEQPVPEWFAHLRCWQRWKEEPFRSITLLSPVHEHFLRACRLMFTPRQLTITPWLERMAKAYTENSEILLLGAGSTGKSHFMGLAFLMDMVAAIGDLYACLVSTDKGALMQRSYASAIEYLNCLKANGIEVPLKFVGQKCAIVPFAAPEDLQGVKSMIKGVAIREGSEQDAKSSVIGVHLPRIRSGADEFENLQNRAAAFLSAQSNLRQGCIDYKMVLAFNPQSLSAPGTQLATPAGAGGWSSLDPDTAEEWFTSNGYCVLRFDGLKSPGIQNPTKYPFLPTQASIGEIVRANHGNQDAPDVWAMVRGFPPLTRAAQTVLSDADLLQFRALETEIIWQNSGTTLIGGLDPAFTSDGDDCVLQLADVGHLLNGPLAMVFRDPIYIKIESSSPVTISYQIVEQLKEHMQATGLALRNLAVDDSGTQSIVDIITKELGVGCLRSDFGSGASEEAVSIADSRPAKKIWGNTGTELWGSFAEYVRYGQVRRLPVVAAGQFTRRSFKPGRRPKILKSKRDSKAEMGGRSPDNADAVSLCGAVMKFVLGVRPGASVLDPGGRIPRAASYDMSRVLALNNLRATYQVRT